MSGMGTPIVRYRVRYSIGYMSGEVEVTVDENADQQDDGGRPGASLRIEHSIEVRAQRLPCPKGRGRRKPLCPILHGVPSTRGRGHMRQMFRGCVSQTRGQSGHLRDVIYAAERELARLGPKAPPNYGRSYKLERLS